MPAPITFIALDRADVDAVTQALADLPREGIYLRRGTLVLETSYLGPGARDVYATAWSYALGDVPLFLTLSSHGRLLMTVAERVIVGVDKHSPWITKKELEESIVGGEVIVVTESAELAYWLRLT
ncbi:hypothetical protein [Corynebacterium singulare]|uniref:hypothetical protein n=1 Tax=Corynebacterium singulare TaxID=161899 RepID=UPI0011A2F891|nr:hypothetical protein [Corynebacterium singulare]